MALHKDGLYAAGTVRHCSVESFNVSLLILNYIKSQLSTFQNETLFISHPIILEIKESIKRNNNVVNIKN